MSLIKYCRCDDRLIHGQVIYKWIEALNVKKLVIIDDEVINDVLEKGLIKLAAPKNLQLEIISIKEAKRYFFNEDDSDKTLVLIRNIETAKMIIDSDIKIKQLILGRIPTEVGRNKITQNVYLNKASINILRGFVSNKVNITIQMVPDEEPINFNENIDEIERRCFI